jgi:hypothetical protein
MAVALVRLPDASAPVEAGAVREGVRWSHDARTGALVVRLPDDGSMDDATEPVWQLVVTV